MSRRTWHALIGKAARICILKPRLWVVPHVMQEMWSGNNRQVAMVCHILRFASITLTLDGAGLMRDRQLYHSLWINLGAMLLALTRFLPHFRILTHIFSGSLHEFVSTLAEHSRSTLNTRLPRLGGKLKSRIRKSCFDHGFSRFVMAKTFWESPILFEALRPPFEAHCLRTRASKLA